MRGILAIACTVLALSVGLGADDHTVLFDEDVNFAAFGTFSLGQGRMTSTRPELNFPAVMASMTVRIRATLAGKGLKEVPDRPDLRVEYSVTGVDFSIGPFGRPNAIRPGGRGGRGATVDFTEATLVIDLMTGSPGTMVWRGVYHDSENDARKLAVALPNDAATLLDGYPPRKR